MYMNVNELIKLLTLKDHSAIAIVGSGASVASGLRTFRGEDGYYRGKFPQELASRYGFSQDPSLVWEWYNMRIKAVLDAQPNPIHRSLVKLEKCGLLDVVITQNVDNLHKRAGQENVIAVHGNILKTHCLENCGITYEVTKPFEDIPVKCPCGSYQRPSVVWFGESLDVTDISLIEQKLLDTELMLIIGTSGNVYPVANFPFIAKQLGTAKLVEFNPHETGFKHVDDLFFQGPAETSLPQFVDQLISAKNAL